MVVEIESQVKMQARHVVAAVSSRRMRSDKDRASSPTSLAEPMPEDCSVSSQGSASTKESRSRREKVSKSTSSSSTFKKEAVRAGTDKVPNRSEKSTTKDHSTKVQEGTSHKAAMEDRKKKAEVHMEMLQTQFDKVAELSQEVKDLTAKICTLSTKLAASKDTITTLRIEKRELKQALKDGPTVQLKEEMIQTKEALADQTLKLRTAHGMISEQDNLIQDLDKQFDTVSAAKEASETRVTQLEKDAKEHQTKIFQLDSELSKIRAQESNAKASETRVAELEKDAKEHQTKIFNLESELSKFRAQDVNVKASETRVTQLEKTAKEHQTKIFQLEAELSKIRAQQAKDSAPRRPRYSRVLALAEQAVQEKGTKVGLVTDADGNEHPCSIPERGDDDSDADYEDNEPACGGPALLMPFKGASPDILDDTLNGLAIDDESSPGSLSTYVELRYSSQYLPMYSRKFVAISRGQIRIYTSANDMKENAMNYVRLFDLGRLANGQYSATLNGYLVKLTTPGAYKDCIFRMPSDAKCTPFEFRQKVAEHIQLAKKMNQNSVEQNK